MAYNELIKELQHKYVISPSIAEDAVMGTPVVKEAVVVLTMPSL